MTDDERLVAGLVDAAARDFPGDEHGEIQADRTALQAHLRRVLGSRVDLGAERSERLVDRACDELLGFGPIQALMNTPGVTDILVNGWSRIVFEQDGRLHDHDARFFGPDHLNGFVHRHVARAGRAVNRASPWVDVELADGSRMHVVGAPVAQGGPFVSIRRFPENPFTLADLQARDAIDEAQRLWLEAAVRERRNIVIAGAPGAGKTTLLGALLGQAPPAERIVLIEDVSELKVDHPHCIKLQTRRIAHGDAQQATIRQLVRETLRMRPDRLVVGEVRGEEVFDMVAAMSIGLSGSLSTLHAGSVDGALRRLASLYAAAALGQAGVDPRAAVAHAIDAIVFLERDGNGRRRVAAIQPIGSPS